MNVIVKFSPFFSYWGAKVIRGKPDCDGKLSRSAEIAAAANSSANHLAQVVHHLHAHGFVHATRGRMGGVKLARSPRAINIGEVFRIFESDAPFTECMALDTNTCPLVRACRLRNAIRRALDAFYREMDLVTLEDLVKGNYLLEELFAVSDATAQRYVSMTCSAVWER